jgi:hypothetical protein
MSSRRLLTRSTIGVFVVAGLAVWWAVRFAPIDVERADVVSIGLDPYPEGPHSPRFVRAPGEQDQKPLALVEKFIPVPLPAPKWQGLSCRVGGHVTVELADGRAIAYGPCRRPDSIDRLRDRILDVLDER